MRLIAAAFIAVAAPAGAVERTLSVTDFDKVRVEGGFTVNIRTAPATTARIIGTSDAIEASAIEVHGRQLVIRRNGAAWSNSPGRVPPPATVVITVPALAGISVSGPAKVSVERLKADRASALLDGAGNLSVGAVAADRMDASAIGSGTLTLAGMVSQLTVVARGAATVDGTKLLAQDLKLISESAGEVTLVAKRVADITMNGTGAVSISGKPACTVRNAGTGTVVCGSNQPQR